MIETKDLRAGYGGREVLHGVSLAFPPGRVTAIAGPNGCGKSTLLRAVLGMVQHMGGQVLFDGVPAEALSSRDIAQRAAYMPQDRPVPSISVRRMALHGRFPYLSYPRRYRREDHEAVEAALRRADALAVMEEGRLRMLDAPEAVFESGVIDEVFGVRLRRMETPDGPQYYFA